jgi:FkbM family methyltransferase
VGYGAWGRFRIDLPDGPRHVRFNARNTQFGALYQPQFQPVYEPDISALIDLIVPNDGCFLDVGANWGWFSLLLASRPGFSGRIHAFEPMPATFADLAGAVRDARLEDRIVCHPLALADHEGSAVMAVPGGVQSGLARISQCGDTAVRLAKLDDLNLPPPDTIKIDVEDHEIEVLRGGAVTIERARPVVVFENWLHRGNPAMTLDPFHWFAARNYCFFHTGWVAGIDDCIIPELPATVGNRATLAVLPFQLEQRFYLPPQLNAVAVPRERCDLFRYRIENAGT